MRIIGCDLHARQQTLAMLDTPTCKANTERTAVRENLVRPLVARPHRKQDASQLVGFVDRQRVMWDELGECVGDPVEQRVEALLCEHVVEDVRETPVGLDEGSPTRRVAKDVLVEEPEWKRVIAHPRWSVCRCSRR